jgi:arginine/lysine/ornithine decarboxylase
MSVDQNQAPLLEALAKYRQSGTVSFGVPGHKSGKGAPDDIKQVIGA